jgi:hypothetical protein
VGDATAGDVGTATTAAATMSLVNLIFLFKEYAE